nr:flowering time control protein FCA isoform X3 [Ipomoea trifida]
MAACSLAEGDGGDDDSEKTSGGLISPSPFSDASSSSFPSLRWRKQFLDVSPPLFSTDLAVLCGGVGGSVKACRIIIFSRFSCSASSTKTTTVAELFGGHDLSVALPRPASNPGCCFIKYAAPEDADGAIRALHNNYTLQGGTCPIQVRYADGERERLGTVEYKLFVGSLNKQASVKEVEEEVQPYSDCREGPSSAPVPPATHLRNSTPAACVLTKCREGPWDLSCGLEWKTEEEYWTRMKAWWGVKGERVIPKDPKLVLGGEIIIGSLDVSGRGMSCGGEAIRDRGEAAAGGGAARADLKSNDEANDVDEGTARVVQSPTNNGLETCERYFESLVNLRRGRVVDDGAKATRSPLRIFHD